MGVLWAHTGAIGCIGLSFSTAQYPVHAVGKELLLPYLQATGNTGLIPWLTSYFYIYYPALIILVCIATALSLGSRLVSILGYQKFIGEDDFSADYIDEGKALMKRGWLLTVMVAIGVKIDGG